MFGQRFLVTGDDRRAIALGDGVSMETGRRRYYCLLVDRVDAPTTFEFDTLHVPGEATTCTELQSLDANRVRALLRLAYNMKEK